MQKFVLTIEVTVNTIEDIPVKEVQEELQSFLNEWDGGTVSVDSADEV